MGMVMGWHVSSTQVGGSQVGSIGGSRFQGRPHQVKPGGQHSGSANVSARSCWAAQSTYIGGIHIYREGVG